MEPFHDFIQIIGVISGGVILALSPFLVLRGREAWRPLVGPVTLIVGTTGFIAGQLLVDGPLGISLGLAVFVPALAISFTSVRAQLAAHTPTKQIQAPGPGAAVDHRVEIARRDADRSETLRLSRNYLLKRGVPVLAVGIGASIWAGLWAPLLVFLGVSGLTGLALWPGILRRLGSPLTDAEALGTGRNQSLEFDPADPETIPKDDLNQG